MFLARHRNFAVQKNIINVHTSSASYRIGRRRPKDPSVTFLLQQSVYHLQALRRDLIEDSRQAQSLVTNTLSLFHPIELDTIKRRNQIHSDNSAELVHQMTSKMTDLVDQLNGIRIDVKSIKQGFSGFVNGVSRSNEEEMTLAVVKFYGDCVKSYFVNYKQVNGKGDMDFECDGLVFLADENSTVHGLACVEGVSFDMNMYVYSIENII